MPTWFLSNVTYQKEEIVNDRRGDQVKVKTITESYLIDAVNHSDAYTQTYENMVSNVKDFQIKDILRRKFSDVFQYDTGDYYYHCKVTADTETENGKPKQLKLNILLNAATEQEAGERVREQMKTWLIPTTVVSISQTKILDVWQPDKED